VKLKVELKKTYEEAVVEVVIQLKEQMGEFVLKKRKEQTVSLQFEVQKRVAREVRFHFEK
jgi:hypothetical protein